MKRTKQKFNIYEAYTTGSGQSALRYIGQTWAVSEKQAVATFCYRTKRLRQDVYGPFEDGYVEVTIIAKSTIDEAIDRLTGGTHEANPQL